jgi:hypothetical protein
MLERRFRVAAVIVRFRIAARPNQKAQQGATQYSGFPIPYT